MPEKQARILVVEDEPHIAADIALRLEGLGYQVIGPVDTGREAIHLAEREKPDLVFMDILLSGDMDGVAAAACILRISIPVIYLTAYADSELLQRAKITEPFAYLIKPCTEIELEAAVVMALYRSRINREMAEYQDQLAQAHSVADANQRRLSTLLGNLPGMVYRCTGHISAPMEFVSDGCFGLTGYTAEQILSGAVDFHSLMHPEDYERVWKTIGDTAVGKRFQIEYRMLHADGKYRWVWEQGCAIPGLDGLAVAYEGFIIDTTEQHCLSEQLQTAHDELERKVAERTAHLEELNLRLQHEIVEREHAQQALRESNERFRVMVEVSSDWVWEIGMDGRYSYVSPKVFDILGYEPGDLLGKSPLDFMPEEEAERVHDIYSAIEAQRTPFQCIENINQHRDGHLVMLETSGVPIMDAAGMFCGFRGVDRDVTERWIAQRALRESERHLRQVIDLVPHMIFAKDAEGRHILANRACADSFGLSVDEVVGRLHSELHPDHKQLRQMLADDRKVIESGQPLLIPEEEYTDAYGACHILRTLKVPYTPPGDERPAILGLAIDITEQKRAEQELAASEQKYRAFMENAVDAILIADAEGMLLDANCRAEALLGYSRDELLQMHAINLHPVEEHERLRDVFQQLVAGDTTLVEHRVTHKDGHLLHVEVAATPIYSGDRMIVQGIFRDLTERRRLEELRAEQERLHKTTLVREVHHRIKNNLQGVVGLLREHANINPVLAETLGAAISQVQSISVVHGLQGQGEDLQIRLCDMLSAIARNASTLTRTHVEPDVELAIHEPILIEKDEAVPVALVINELILNAVKHARQSTGKPHVSVMLTQQGQNAKVRVMNPGQLPEGFDYVSGRGIGTGLALVRSLLPHVGALLVISQTENHVQAQLELQPPVVKT